MGQFISASRNNNSNDELVNTLIKREYIHTTNVEQAFRCVDRGLYYTSSNKENAYRDTAWQLDKVHLSAPSVYATVLECLDLHKGQKFLNIGSGVGYFSTLAGLLLGVNGVNHGIEIHKSLIDIAYTKLEEFKRDAAAIDYFDFCEPVFIEGNACELLSVGYYDRVYCGAGVPPAESSFMKALIKVDGVLVMPLEGFLVKIIRTGEYSWKTIDVLEVSFTDLVVPEKCNVMNVAKFPPVEPMSLLELCRSNIRASIRDSLKESFPELQMRTKCKPNKSYDQKFFNIDDPSGQFVRVQYGPTEGGIVNLRNIVDTFAGLDEAISDVGSTSENEVISDVNSSISETEALSDVSLTSGTEANREDNDNDGDCDYDDDDDNDDDAKENKSKQCDKRLQKKTESDTKRKSSEAGCSEENKTLPGKSENRKKMRMNISSTAKNRQNNQLNNRRNSDLWVVEDYASNKSSSDDRLSWTSNEDNANNVRNRNFDVSSLLDVDNSHESDSDGEAARELILYRFLSERKDNELSKLLKVKIDLLPVPNMLKTFLNYYKKM
uniref:Protein-L-isoaspartate O-methyltransferase domain-containing protein 2 n=1 Tax=Melanaphis sacchari TaxID=742174 RepID=A0A2H8U1W3_9HEMI